MELVDCLNNFGKQQVFLPLDSKWFWNKVKFWNTFSGRCEGGRFVFGIFSQDKSLLKGIGISIYISICISMCISIYFQVDLYLVFSPQTKVCSREFGMLHYLPLLSINSPVEYIQWHVDWNNWLTEHFTTPFCLELIAKNN